MNFPIDILTQNNTIEAILNEIYNYKKKILHKIRISYIYNVGTLRLKQDIMNRIRRKGTFSPEISRFNKTTPQMLGRYFRRMEYTLSQFRFLLLNYLVIENIGSPKNTLKEIMNELSLYKRSAADASKARHSMVDFMYYPPSQMISYFLKKSSRKAYILNNILKCSEENIPQLLRKLKIEDTIHSLSMGNRKLYCFLLLNGFKLNEINEFSASMGVRVEGGMKIEKIQNFIHHTNIGPDLIIEHMSENRLEEERTYFIKAFNLDENLNGEALRQAIIKSMKNFNIAMDGEFEVDSQYLKFEHIAEDGHICDSNWERIIDNFLNHHKIDHEKPRSANYDEYYRDSYMYPDWVIGKKNC